MHYRLNERTSERLHVDTRCGLATYLGYVQARLVDVSGGGARVYSPVRLAAGSQVSIVLCTGSSVPCTVIRHDADGKAGLSFVDPRRAASALAAARVAPAQALRRERQRNYASFVGQVSEFQGLAPLRARGADREAARQHA